MRKVKTKKLSEERGNGSDHAIISFGSASDWFNLARVFSTNLQLWIVKELI